MINLNERKLTLFIRTQQLKRQLDSLKQLDHREPRLPNYTGRRVYLGLMDLVESLDRMRK